MENLSNYPDRIAETFENKTVFITGGTGFLGKVLVEKILRCFNVKKLFLLIREKKGKDPASRLKEVFDNPLFEKLRNLRGETAFDVCVPISGDVGLKNLGISPENRAILINEVEIVFHGAATIRFDDPLKKAVLLNVRGTKFMLELAKEMKKLMIFAHISTSYCHLGEKVLYEKVYPPPANPHQIIKTVEWMEESLVENMTPTILGDNPNTYAFTKGLGEGLVSEQMDKLPVLILRPSVVVPIWLEPIPGWTDNINGPTGLLIGAGKGVLRTMYCNGEGYADFVPVDIVANACVTAVWDAIRTNRTRKIFNICSTADYKVSWDDMIALGRKVVYERMPLNGVAWYPGGSMKRYKFVHKICVILYHYLPALLIDSIVPLFGYKPFMWQIQQRITKGFDVFEYYANNQWDFSNEDGLKAVDEMNPREKEFYKLNGKGIDYYEYFTNCTHAARLYILKESDDTLPAARRHMKIMYFVDLFTKLFFLSLILYVLYHWVVTPILSRF
nr:putative fatty acyl-CoA reductase CG5065 [Onthophagus taurus]XP_022902013.1 putative fatty acyl-CoA reductase CG5065 [Onthophagus taurus]